MPVHIFGHPVDMDPLLALADKPGLAVIEDAAEAHGAEYKGRRVGALGDLGCPNLLDQRQILDLLDASRIGVVMSDADQLHPEQSTSAIVIVHPQAKYFSV